MKERGRAAAHILIIGGGITGLAAAHRLTSIAPNHRITLIERAPRLGGKILTVREDGFIVEGGPDSFLSVKPRGVGLCRELGIADRLHGPDPAKRGAFVLRHGRLQPLPEGLTGLIPSRLGPMARTGLLSPRGKARMALDYLLPRRAEGDDESLASFIERRLGREVYDRLVEPLLAGIYAGDGRQLSLAATFPQLRQGELAHGGLIRGVLAAKRRAAASSNGAAPQPGFLTLPSGLAELVETLRTQLEAAGVEVRLGTGATGLRPGSGGAGYEVALDDGTVLPAAAVIIATPAWAAAGLLSGLDPEASDCLAAIPHVSSATVALAYRASDLPRPLDGYGYVVPRAEGRPLLACTWLSAKWPGRAPAGTVLIRGFVGRAGQADPLAQTDDTLAKVVQDEVRDTLGITAVPLRRWVFRWERAMPQYTLGHLDRLARLEQSLAAHPGLFIAGNALRGVGIPDCIATGEGAADAAARLVSGAA